MLLFEFYVVVPTQFRKSNNILFVICKSVPRTLLPLIKINVNMKCKPRLLNDTKNNKAIN
jgi:hypothetical protein